MIAQLDPLAVLAALPLLVIVVLMLAAHWSAARAGAAGFLVTVVLAWFAFGYGRVVYGELGVPTATGGALLEALFTAATILWIIFPALCIHQLQVRTGALDVLRQAIGRLSRDPRLVVFLVAWFFALFIEGAAGFGTTVALAAPFLVGVGYRPVDAVTIALIGHAVGVSFGAIGTPILPQIAATGFDPLSLARANAFYHGLLGWILILFVMDQVRRAPLALPAERSRLWGWALLAALLFFLPYLAIARWIGPELPTLGGALVGGLIFVGALRLAAPPSPHGERIEVGRPSGLRTLALLRAASPYLFVVLLILLTRLVPPLARFLSELRLEWSVAGVFGGSIQPLYHPGTVLLAGFFLGALWQGVGARSIGAAMGLAARQLVPVTVALVLMLSLARLMVHAGMIERLAAVAAENLGAAWPLLSPMIGVLGTFVTGSATASNILFSDFQQATARNLDLSVLVLIGAQGFGAAVGNIICPHNIIAGVATVNATGEEGVILRRTLPPCLVYAVAGGLLAWFLAG